LLSPDEVRSSPITPAPRFPDPTVDQTFQGCQIVTKPSDYLTEGSSLAVNLILH